MSKNQVSSDGTNFANLYSLDGTEAMIPVVPGSAVIIAAGLGSQLTRVEPPDLRGVSWLKVRSGASGWPVIQVAQRQFTVVLDG